MSFILFDKNSYELICGKSLTYEYFKMFG